jgi:hypothetical protein
MKVYSGRTIANKLRKHNPSQTPGKAKQGNCKSTPLSRYMARKNRSYKHQKYEQWCILKNGEHVTSAGPND